MHKNPKRKLYYKSKFFIKNNKYDRSKSLKKKTELLLLGNKGNISRIKYQAKYLTIKLKIRLLDNSCLQ